MNWLNKIALEKISNLPTSDAPIEPNVQVLQSPITNIPTPDPELKQYETSFNPWIKYNKVLGYYLNVIGVDPLSPEGQHLTRLGYKFSRKSFGKALKTGEDVIRSQEELGSIEETCGCKFADTWLIEARKEAFPDKSAPKIEADQGAEKQVEMILDSATLDPMRKKELTEDFIRAKIAELAEMTDQSAKNEFIMKFLAVRPEFHDYSFTNKIMMLLQKPDVSPFVASKRKWQDPNGKFRREVIVPEEEALQIFTPAKNSVMVFYAKKALESLKNALSRGTRIVTDRYTFAEQLFPPRFEGKGDKNYYVKDFLRFCLDINDGDVAKTIRYVESQVNAASGKYIWYGKKKDRNGNLLFDLGKTYDISQTRPIDENSFKEPEKGFWQSEQNQSDPMIFSYVQAIVEWAKTARFQMGNEWKEGINIDLAYKAGREGGWSQGSKIAIDQMSAGLRQFATSVHEVSHSILHFGPGRELLTSRQKEIEAEAVVFVVLNFFGFPELTFAANYLALHKATGTDVLSRYNAIDSAARKIIGGIQKHLGVQRQGQSSSNWLQRVIFSYFSRTSIMQKVA